MFAVLVFAVLYFRQTPIEPQLTKLQLRPPEKSSFGAIEVSPDGRRVAFTATDSSGKTQLWVRALDSLVAQPLPDTGGASYPFWSPDSRVIGFFADGKLKKVEASGGSPQTICSLINYRGGAGGARGGSWGRDGVILFAVEPFHAEPLYQVSSTGGEPRPVTTLEPSNQENHHHWPTFLPDGRHFLYFSASNTHRERTGIYVASLDANDARLLVNADTAATYSPSPPAARGTDYIVFVRERTLMAQPFDSRRLSTVGDAMPIAEQVGVDAAGPVEVLYLGERCTGLRGRIRHRAPSLVRSNGQASRFTRTARPLRRFPHFARWRQGRCTACGWAGRSGCLAFGAGAGHQLTSDVPFDLQPRTCLVARRQPHQVHLHKGTLGDLRKGLEWRRR